MFPDDRLAVVRRLQEEGHVVAMVGDGTNDAPALTLADVALAAGRLTEVASVLRLGAGRWASSARTTPWPSASTRSGWSPARSAASARCSPRCSTTPAASPWWRTRRGSRAGRTPQRPVAASAPRGRLDEVAEGRHPGSVWR